MTKLDEAFKEAQKEVNEKELKQLKGYFKQVLTAIEVKKKQKERVEEELRILKLDLEDLKAGKFDKIKERQKKSEVARQASPLNLPCVTHAIGLVTDTDPNWYKGTYRVTICNTNDITDASMLYCSSSNKSGFTEPNKTFYF